MGYALGDQSGAFNGLTHLQMFLEIEDVITPPRQRIGGIRSRWTCPDYDYVPHTLRCTVMIKM
jgi:hypothetical protein